MATYRKAQDQELGDADDCWGIYRQLAPEDLDPDDESSEELVAVAHTETLADLILATVTGGEPQSETAFQLPVVGSSLGGSRRVIVRELDDGALALDIQGCGLADMEEGRGEVVVLENRGAGPLLRIWGDINRSDVTHEIWLDAALEEYRHAN